MFKKEQEKLTTWFEQNKRSLPWRRNKDAYSIWISEVMLQQTTVVAVIPFYEKFMTRFPNVQKLAQAKIEDVYEYWAGLGYYSRARNIHKSAQIISKLKSFPQGFSELLKLPGFGPYTARAVASLAFGEEVGVLDGNVIRVLCRYLGLKKEFWRPSVRDELQKISDQFVKNADPHIINQALMELGATVCTPSKPLCLLCPIQKNCVAFAKNLTESLPLKKPRKQKEYWVWSAHVVSKNKKIALVQNEQVPFLKKQWMFLGHAKKSTTKPKVYDLTHTITHHHIFVQISYSNQVPTTLLKGTKVRWIKPSELKSINPASLLQKILKHEASKSCDFI